MSLALSAVTLQAPRCDHDQLWLREQNKLATIVNTLPSDLDKTTFLRTYTGELIDIGRLPNQQRQRYGAINFDSFSLGEFYPLFKRDSIPAECGITTFFYIKLLQTFGFKAYQYSFGFTEKPYDRFVHSVVLVEINFRGARRLIIQDPYLNLTYRDQNGEPFDFFHFLTAIKNKQYRAIVMDSVSSKTFLMVPEPSVYEAFLSEDCKTLLHQTLRQEDGSLKTKLPITRDYSTLMRSSCFSFENAFVNALHEHGYREPFIYAYTLRVSDLVGDSDHQEVQRRIDSLLHPE
jgi:hypothetical protein